MIHTKPHEDFVRVIWCEFLDRSFVSVLIELPSRFARNAQD